MDCFFDSVDEYNALLSASQKVVCANVISAVPLSEEEKADLIRSLEKKYMCRVSANYSVDASLIGGLIVDVDGNVLDGSLRRRLQEVKDVIGK